MTANLLKHQFGRLVDTGDALPPLRRLIHNLAMSGRLTGGSKNGWTQTTLGAIGSWGSGGTPSKSHPEYYGGTIPWLVIGDLNDGIVTKASTRITDAGLANSSAKVVEPGTVLVAMYGSIGKLGIAGIRCATNQAIAHCVPDSSLLSRDFLALTLRAFRDELESKGQGGTQKNISQTILKSYPIELPPLAEQHRIVAKVDELMALCDEMEAAQTERESRRDRLVTASLARLSSSDGGSDDSTFRQDASFYLNRLPRLTTRPEHVVALRQTILDLAVQGRLVEQEPSAPGGAALERQGRAAEVPDDTSWPFDVPVSWSWQRIETLASQVTDGEHSTPERIADQQVPLVTAKNVRDGYMDLTRTDWVSAATANKAWVRCRPSRGDILLVCVGATIGRLTVLREDREMVLVRSVALVRPTSQVDVDYLAIVLRSPLGQSEMKKRIKATGQPCLYINRIKDLPVPVPLLSEQERIVAKVEQLMNLCDELGKQLEGVQIGRMALLEALLSGLHSQASAA